MMIYENSHTYFNCLDCSHVHHARLSVFGKTLNHLYFQMLLFLLSYIFVRSETYWQGEYFLNSWHHLEWCFSPTAEDKEILGETNSQLDRSRSEVLFLPTYDTRIQ